MRLGQTLGQPQIDVMHHNPSNQRVTLLGNGPGDRCPTCRLPLVHAQVVHQPVLYCTHCQGMLIAMAVLPTLVESLNEPFDPNTPEPPSAGEHHRHIDCPRCHIAMDPHFYAGPSHLVMDSCDACNLNWLSRDELRHIARAPEYALQTADSTH